MDKTVIIAEDNPGLAKVLSFKFKSCGFKALVCPNGRIAWETFQSEDVMAIVSDQEMPEMTGLELCEKVRGLDPSIPFFLVTGRQIELKSSQKCDGLNISEIIGKPFSPAKVVAAVETAIGANANHGIA